MNIYIYIYIYTCIAIRVLCWGKLISEVLALSHARAGLEAHARTRAHLSSCTSAAYQL